MDVIKDTELYSRILGIDEPWRVEKVEIDVHEQAIRVFLQHTDATSWQCAECGKVSPLYDHREQREWRHLDSCQFKTFLVASLPRINCCTHGIHTVKAPWSHPNSRFTLLFEAFAIDVLLAAKVQVSAAGLLRLSQSQVHDIMQRSVQRGVARRDKSEAIKHLTIDEKSFHQGHNYITVLGDPEGHRIIDVAESRTQDAVENLLANSLSMGQRQGIEAVAMDMWKAFLNAREKILPDADTVHDKFHIAGYLSDAVDKTRRAENRELMKRDDSTLKQTKYLWLRSPEHMTIKHLAALESLAGLEIETAKVWMFKENFRHFFTCKDVSSAKDFFVQWHEAAVALGNRFLTQVADMLAGHLDGLLAYTKHKITNSYAESINGMIQLLKANARGFRRFENFRTAILFYHGGLNLYPQEIP